MKIDLNEFYRLKNQFYKSKEPRKCINCNRVVGTIFKAEYYEDKRILKISCGDTVKPCDLNKEVTVQKDKLSFSNLRELINQKNEEEREILKLKSKLLYNVINDTVFNKEFDIRKNTYKTLIHNIQNAQAHIEKRHQSSVILIDQINTLIDDNSRIEDSKSRIQHMIEMLFPLVEQLHKTLEVVVQEDSHILISKPI